MTFLKLKNNFNSHVPAVYGDFFNDFFNDSVLSRDYFKSVPATNVKETNNAYHIELAAPGLSKDDFKLSVEKNVLTISASKKEEKNTEDNGKFTRREFNYTSFTRSFNLPENVNTESIEASYLNGVLSVNIPKKEAAKEKAVREIKIA